MDGQNSYDWGGAAATWFWVDPSNNLAFVGMIQRRGPAGAGLDVFAAEPPALENRLRIHPAVVATPHAASVTREGRRRMEEMAMDRLLAFFRSERPADIVNPAAWQQA